MGSLEFLRSSGGVDSPAPETEELRSASSNLTQLQPMLQFAKHYSAKKILKFIQPHMDQNFYSERNLFKLLLGEKD